jgi:hypothetical protein
MAVLYVGIVEGVEPGAVALAVVDDGFSQDDGSGGMAAQLFQLELTHLNEYWVPQPDGRKTFHPTPDIYEISALLNERIRVGDSPRFAVEVPAVLYPPRDVSGTGPAPALPTDSVILKLLVLLGVHGYLNAPLRLSPDETVAFPYPVPRDGEFAHLFEGSPRYIEREISQAYGELLAGTCDRVEHTAVVAALIAKNPGAFHFWSSIGLVQSSSDVLHVFPMAAPT